MKVIVFLIMFTGILYAQIKLPISSNTVVHHKYYSLEYSETHEQAKWVFYMLTKDRLPDEKVKRLSNFRYDPLVKTQSANNTHYVSSGYDRGHLVPAADMAFNKEAMYESFYTSNISPQDPALNRGTWRVLESKIRKSVDEGDTIYIVTGPILKSVSKLIGNVAVPKYFYKIVYDKVNNTMVSYIIPNSGLLGKLSNYIVTTDEVEEITNINFFSGIPNEEEIESKKGELWKL